MEEKFHLYQNASQWNLTVEPIRNIVQIFNRLEKHYWLAGGTLLGKDMKIEEGASTGDDCLGWYRHCGLIPFTSDADFGLFAEEYDERIREEFLGNPISYLWGALGLVSALFPSFEIIDRDRLGQ